jgi:hypothetical protein
VGNAGLANVGGSYSEADEAPVTDAVRALTKERVQLRNESKQLYATAGVVRDGALTDFWFFR